jgi:DNA-binding Lrp family transcriptional regulator
MTERKAVLILRHLRLRGWDPKRGLRAVAGSNTRMTGMLTAIVFVNADVARIPEVAEEIASLSGVSEVYSVTGTIDLIVMIRVANHDQIAEVVADRLNKVPGVVSTETHIAFRTYSAHDLEAAFSLGG